MERNNLIDILRGGEFPARLRPEQVARLLGFTDADIPILIRKRLLKPLGKPRPNATKFFSLADVIEKSQDQQWLTKATQAIYDHWRNKNERKSDDRFQRAA